MAQGRNSEVSDWSQSERRVSHPSLEDRPGDSPTQTLPSNHTAVGVPRRSEGDESRGNRASQACLRCRRKKLRCTGGCPCTKCEQVQEKCDFGKKAEPDSRHPSSSAGPASTARIAQLERIVADLLSDLSNVRDGGPAGVGNAMASGSSNTMPSYPTHIPSPQLFGGSSLFSGFPVTSDDCLRSYPPLPSSSGGFAPNSSSTVLPARGVHFGPSPTESQGSGQEKPKSKESPQERLAVASLVGEGFSAPFQALTYHPGVWDNKEQSRRSSPQPGAQSRDETWPAFEAKAGPRDDPMTLELVDARQAETLFDFFFSKCHPFLPILAASETDGHRFDDIRRRCSFLFTTVIAIGARFYLRHCRRHDMSTSISGEAPAALARLAYSHLAASLFRKQHQLADVQATLLLAGWGLQSGGGGPDPWLVTGHCARLAQRLGLHRLGKVPPTPEAAEKYLHRSRTWLGWYHFDSFLSLGFGRPQSPGFEGLNEQSFLQLCASAPNRTETRLDLYIASMVQLTKIGRDLITWIQLLTDRQTEASSSSLVMMGTDRSIGPMLGELNKRLDEWTTMWTWNGSLSAIQLGKSGRLAKLQSEHIRLCLNSLALKPGLLETGDSPHSLVMTSYIQKATEAAINTIQAHADAVKEDMYLSYSVDYVTIALGQAAVFLIRLHSTPSNIPIDRAVIAHYLRTAIELLEDTDLSDTRNSTYVGRVCRDLSGVAGIAIPPRVSEESPFQLQFWTEAGLPMLDGNTDVDLASFLQFDNSGVDLGMLFGLPTDGLNAGDFGLTIG